MEEKLIESKMFALTSVMLSYEPEVFLNGRKVEARINIWTLRVIYIRITFSCNVYPLTSHFYIVKLGFTGVYIIFLFLL